VLVLIKVSLYKLLKISEPHLPCLALLRLHLVESALAQPVLDMLFKPVVEEGASAETSCPDSRLFHADWF
jgi:hypothetical protein